MQQPNLKRPRSDTSYGQIPQPQSYMPPGYNSQFQPPPAYVNSGLPIATSGDGGGGIAAGVSSYESPPLNPYNNTFNISRPVAIPTVSAAQLHQQQQHYVYPPLPPSPSPALEQQQQRPTPQQQTLYHQQQAAASQLMQRQVETRQILQVELLRARSLQWGNFEVLMTNAEGVPYGLEEQRQFEFENRLAKLGLYTRGDQRVPLEAFVSYPRAAPPPPPPPPPPTVMQPQAPPPPQPPPQVSLVTPAPSPQPLRAPPKAEITMAFLNLLPIEVQQTLLLTAIRMHQDIYTLAVTARAEEAARQASRHLNFDHLSKACWHAIKSSRDSDGGGGNGQPLANGAIKVRETILHILKNEILAKVGDDSSYETKRSALETLRNIGKTCWTAEPRYLDDCVADSEIMKVIGDGMEGVADSMSIEERAMFLHNNPVWLASCSELWNTWVEDNNVAANLGGGLAEVMRIFGLAIPLGLQ